LDIENAKKTIAAHGQTIPYVAYQCYISAARRLYRFLSGERKLSTGELHRLSQYIDYLESIELFREGWEDVKSNNDN